jgi:hypothetical protein
MAVKIDGVPLSRMPDTGRARTFAKVRFAAPLRQAGGKFGRLGKLP